MEGITANVPLGAGMLRGKREYERLVRLSGFVACITYEDPEHTITVLWAFAKENNPIPKTRVIIFFIKWVFVYSKIRKKWTGTHFVFLRV